MEEKKFKVGDRISHKFGGGVIERDVGDYFDIRWDEVPTLEQNGRNRTSLILKTEARELKNSCECDCNEDCGG
jgi:hypothetical protein